MTPRQLYKSDLKTAKEIAAAAGTNFNNFKQIALYNGSVSRTLAKRLSEQSHGKMSVLEILFPEDFGDD